MIKYSAVPHLSAVAGYSAMSWSLHESLVILAALLICGLHPEQVDSLTDQQLFGVPHGIWRQEARPAEDPGVVDVEQAEDVCARVHNGEAGVVGGQNPVGAVGSNWEQKSQRQEGDDHDWSISLFIRFIQNLFMK